MLVIYNHRYDKNIPIVENLYKDKFSHIYHLMPFYDGERENVLSVYANSLHFQSYIAQAYQQIHKMKKQYTHYFVIADDMLLNPTINERNLFDFFKIDDKSCYIRDIRVPAQKRMNDKGLQGLWLTQYRFKLYKPKVEVQSLLPSREEALARFAEHGINAEVRFADKIRLLLWWISILRPRATISAFIALFKRKVNYPLVWAFSDCLLIPASHDNFFQYCGAFAALDLFVEYAIPTSLLLSADCVATDQKQGLSSIANEMDVIADIEKKHRFDLKKLIENFPDDLVFIHPIKLSKWK